MEIKIFADKIWVANDDGIQIMASGLSPIKYEDIESIKISKLISNKLTANIFYSNKETSLPFSSEDINNINLIIEKILALNPNCLVDKEAILSPEELAELNKKRKEQKEEEANKLNSVMLSTCQFIDGYKTTKQYGLVFGETFIKMGFFKSLGASIENISIYLPGDRELSGTEKLFKDAREFAINKMKTEAYSLGANAIIGIDFETSIVNEIMHITINGTAVYVEKE